MENSNINHEKRSASDVSFLVRIIFRRNASFQGVVHRLDNNKKRSFRSSMELVALMQEAMSEIGVPETDYTLRSWKKDQLDQNTEQDEVNIINAANTKG